MKHWVRQALGEGRWTKTKTKTVPDTGNFYYGLFQIYFSCHYGFEIMSKHWHHFPNFFIKMNIIHFTYLKSYFFPLLSLALGEGLYFHVQKFKHFFLYMGHDKVTGIAAIWALRAWVWTPAYVFAHQVNCLNRVQRESSSVNSGLVLQSFLHKKDLGSELRWELDPPYCCFQILGETEIITTLLLRFYEFDSLYSTFRGDRRVLVFLTYFT